MTTENGGQIARATLVDVPMKEQRSLATVTAEIRAYQDAARRMMVEYSIEIGRRLCEAKEMVDHGEWGSYLREELGFSQSTANNLMNVFRGYAADQIRLDGAALKSQAFANLTYTQAVALLVLPEQEREEFVTEHDMSRMSTRELREELRRRGEDGGTDSSAPLRSAQNDRTGNEDGEGAAAYDEDDPDPTGDRAMLEWRLEQTEEELAHQKELVEKHQVQSKTLEKQLMDAKKALETAEEQSKTAEHQAQLAAEDLGKAQKAMKSALDAKRKAEQELKAAKSDRTVPAETLEKLRKEAEQAAQKQLEELRKEAEEAKAKYIKAEEEASKARQDKETADKQCLSLQQKQEAMQKELALAAPELAVFRAQFERAQADLSALIESVAKLPEDKQAGARRGLAALLQKMHERIGGGEK